MENTTINAGAFSWTGDAGTACARVLPPHSHRSMRILSPKTGKTMVFTRKSIEVKDGNLIINYAAREPFVVGKRFYDRTFTATVIYERGFARRDLLSASLKELKQEAHDAAMSATYSDGSWDHEVRNIVAPLERDVRVLGSWIDENS